MCTLVALWRVSRVAPLVIAQCRDELVGRASIDVARFDVAGRALRGGRDAVAGGTWFAIGPRVVAGLTNRRVEGGSPRGAKSRGALVVAAASADDVDAAAARLAAEDGAAYGPFYLLAADDRRMIAARVDGDRVVVDDVPPGVHVLGNFGLNEPTDPVVRHVGAAARALVDADEATLVRGLQSLLAAHGEGRPCVHLAAGPDGPVRLTTPDGAVYGTRSAGVLLARAERPVWLTTDGPPCTSPWRDSSSLLAAR